MTERFTHIKRPSRGTGRQCLHCGRPATITATRVARYGGGHPATRLQVRYCDEHAQVRGAK
jgi:hypothetical protein